VVAYRVGEVKTKHGRKKHIEGGVGMRNLVGGNPAQPGSTQQPAETWWNLAGPSGNLVAETRRQKPGGSLAEPDGRHVSRREGG